MFEWSLDAISGATSIVRTVMAVPVGSSDLVSPDGVEIVEGGATRAESVANALALCETDLVVVHDAARPLVTSRMFDSVIERLAADESLAGAIVASAIHDTVKRVGDDESVSETIDRSTLRAAETPQAFRTAALREAIDSGPSDATDEAMIVEAAGGKVALVESGEENFKVTDPPDLERAAAILGSRG